MALPLPVQPGPIMDTPPRPLTAFMERRYRPSPEDALVLQKYLFGEYNLLAGSELEQVNPGSGPAANYFTPLKRFPAWEVQFEWNDLNAFYWWWPLPEAGGEFELDAGDYFPAGERIALEPSEPDAERIELTPSEPDAERIPNPAYEVE